MGVDASRDHPVVQGFAILAACIAVVLDTWWAVIAFAGGHMPILGIETNGSFGFGVVWVLFIAPIAVTLVYWATILLLAPFVVLSGRRDN